VIAAVCVYRRKSKPIGKRTTAKRIVQPGWYSKPCAARFCVGPMTPKGVGAAGRNPSTICGFVAPNPLGRRFLVLTAAGAALSAVALGVPTAIIPNPLFHRIIAAGPSNYFFWASTSVVTGALLATYALPRTVRDRAAEAGLGGGFLAFLAVGCPVCNKAVVMLIGTSGAVSIFQPIQPVLGALGLILASIALGVRLRGIRRGCEIDVSAIA
jgi:hypothetical protein